MYNVLQDFSLKWMYSTRFKGSVFLKTTIFEVFFQDCGTGATFAIFGSMVKAHKKV